ncbi:MAG: hypothetical protein AB7O49_21170 [Sphingomonadales bacterium]
MLAIVVGFAVVVAVVAALGIRGIGVTDQKFEEIEAEFHRQCIGAFGSHVNRADELCGCLWEEVSGEGRLEMMRRLTALDNGTDDERREFMTRVATDCAKRLGIARR